MTFQRKTEENIVSNLREGAGIFLQWPFLGLKLRQNKIWAIHISDSPSYVKGIRLLLFVEAGQHP